MQKVHLHEDLSWKRASMLVREMRWRNSEAKHTCTHVIAIILKKFLFESESFCHKLDCLAVRSRCAVMAESDGFVSLRYRGLDLSSSEDDTTVIADSSDSEHSVEEISEQDELPQPAAIARKRSVASNSSEKTQARTGSDKYLKNLSNAVRISEHPGEYLERRDFK